MIKECNIFYILFVILAAFFSSGIVYGDTKKLPLPRFATIKSNEVNARTGPKLQCVIEWVFIKKGEPIEIYAEFEQWRQIRDMNGEGGWVHVSVLSGKRGVVILGNDIVPLTSKPVKDSQIIANLAPGLRCIVTKSTINHCKLKCNNIQGWVEKKKIWGVYEKEIF